MRFVSRPEVADLFRGHQMTRVHQHVAELARHLRPATAAPDEDEEIHLERMPLAELEQRAAAGEIRDAKTLAALYLARAYLRQ